MRYYIDTNILVFLITEQIYNTIQYKNKSRNSMKTNTNAQFQRGHNAKCLTVKICQAFRVSWGFDG